MDGVAIPERLATFVGRLSSSVGMPGRVAVAHGLADARGPGRHQVRAWLDGVVACLHRWVGLRSVAAGTDW